MAMAPPPAVQMGVLQHNHVRSGSYGGPPVIGAAPPVLRGLASVTARGSPAVVCQGGGARPILKHACTAPAGSCIGTSDCGNSFSFPVQQGSHQAAPMQVMALPAASPRGSPTSQVAVPVLMVPTAPVFAKVAASGPALLGAAATSASAQVIPFVQASPSTLALDGSKKEVGGGNTSHSSTTPATVADHAASQAFNEAKTKDAGGADGTGGAVNIDGRTFDRVLELGRGSFGVVWEVRERSLDNGEVSNAPSAPSDRSSLALKWSTPAKRELMEACLLEADILKQLAARLPAAAATGARVPFHVAHGVVAARTKGPMGVAPPGQSHVLLVMSKLEGQPLDQWIYGVDEQAMKTMKIEHIIRGPLRNSRLASRGLNSACGTAAGLLRQMAPIFRVLEGIAVHRDVSAHNFLVRQGKEGSGVEQFAVLDFGLAVRARSWQQEWQSRNIAGDPRYFAPAAWMLLTFGYKYLEAHPDANFRRQYRDRIDHFSLGSLSIEVVFALWDCPDDPTCYCEDDEEEKAAKDIDVKLARHSAVAKARSSWHAYWADAISLYQRFHTEGALAIRQELSRSQVLSHMVDKLRILCSALRTAANLYPSGSLVSSVFSICAGLLDWKSSWPSWQDIPGILSQERPVDSERAQSPSPLLTSGKPAPPSEGTSIDATNESGAALRLPIHCVSATTGIDFGVEASPGVAPSTPRSPERLMRTTHRRVNTSLDVGTPCSRVPMEENPVADAVVLPVTPTKATYSTEQESPKTSFVNPASSDSNDFLVTPRSPPLGLEAIAEAEVATAALAAPAEGARVCQDPADLRISPQKLPSQTSQMRSRFSHRRSWTVDEAVSLARGVPQIGLGPGEANLDAPTPSDDHISKRLAFGHVEGLNRDGLGHEGADDSNTTCQ